MKIWILVKESWKRLALRQAFGADAEAVCGDLVTFLKDHDVECVAVVPSNAYGFIDQEYDGGIEEWFGEELQESIRQYIVDHYYGEQPVAMSFLLDARKGGQKVIHTPIGRFGSKPIDPTVRYQAIRTILMTALEHRVESIVIPFPDDDGLFREADVPEVAKMMRLAYDQITHPDLIKDRPDLLNLEIKWDGFGFRRRQKEESV